MADKWFQFNELFEFTQVKTFLFFNHHFYSKKSILLKKFSNFDSCGNVLNLKEVHQTNFLVAITNKNTQNIYKLKLLDKVNFALFFF